MSTRLKALREQRGQAVTRMRSLLDKAAAENRDLSSEETATYQALETEQEGLKAQVEREERQAALDADMGRVANTPARIEPTSPAAAPNGRQDPRATPEYRAAYDHFLATGERKAALQADDATKGGFLVAPTQMVNDLIKAVDDLLFVRQYATKFTVVGADSLGVPSLDADPADPEWTSEIATVAEDSTMKLGRRELRPTQLAKLIKVSMKLLRKTAGGAEALVRDRLAYKHAVAQEKAFMTGSGAGQPLGIYTAHDSGVTTARDMATDNTGTAITGDGLINAKYHLKPQYWSQARWNFHRDAIKMIRKIKSAVDGNYIWQPGLAAGVPDRILDLPFDVSEFAPNTFTSGLYVGALCHWPSYWIADGSLIELQRLAELYAATSQIGIIGRSEVDGMPVLAEAFVRVKLG